MKRVADIVEGLEGLTSRFGDKRYSLRTTRLAEMSDLLGDYLSVTEPRGAPRRRG